VLLYHCVSIEIKKHLNSLIKVEMGFVKNMEKEKASRKQLFVRLVEVDLYFTVFFILFCQLLALDIAYCLEDMTYV
jgi:hypothetical protein